MSPTGSILNVPFLVVGTEYSVSVPDHAYAAFAESCTLSPSACELSPYTVVLRPSALACEPTAYVSLPCALE